mgnify:CR=1 FL=1
MRDYIAKVTQISLVNYKIISISCESGIHFSPGQYFLLDKFDRHPQNLVRQIIYPMSTGQNEYSFKLPMIEDNQLDVELTMRAFAEANAVPVIETPRLVHSASATTSPASTASRRRCWSSSARRG